MPANNEKPDISGLTDLTAEEKDLINACSVIFSKKMQDEDIANDIQKLQGKKITRPSAKNYLIQELMTQIQEKFPPEKENSNLLTEEKMKDLNELVTSFTGENPELNLLLKIKKPTQK